MSHKTIIVLSGKKQSGKDTFANQLALAYAQATDKTRCIESGFFADADGFPRMGMYPLDLSTSSRPAMFQDMGIATTSFAFLLKEFVVNVLGVCREHVYGNDLQKNMECHLTWDDLPMCTRRKYGTWRWWWPFSNKPRTGKMTVREALQVFGTDVIRKWYPDAWAESCYNHAIKSSDRVVIITDGRFPNEIGIGVMHGVNSVNDSLQIIAVKLTRARYAIEDTHPSETALDDYPMSNFDVIVPRDVSVAQMWKIAQDVIRQITSFPTAKAA